MLFAELISSYLNRLTIKFLLILIVFITQLDLAKADAVPYKVVDIDSIKENKSQIIDRSIEKSEPSKFYYGYKLSASGFFLAPELIKQSSGTNLNVNSVNNQLNQMQSIDRIINFNSYNIKTNIGFDFNKYFSAFISYNLASVSLNNSRNINSQINTRYFDYNNIAIGSQFNFSNSFGVKISCSNQQIIASQNLNNQSQQIGCNNLKIGTIYGF